jgi:methylated-DNA-protein-cysteine methyltransferase-like protein
MDDLTPFERIKIVIKAIPYGEVMGYGEVGEAAGFPRAARTVTWVLKTSSEKDGLPWHRVVNKQRRIAIRNPDGHHLQRALLESEGWKFDETGKMHRPEHEEKSVRKSAKEDKGRKKEF